MESGEEPQSRVLSFLAPVQVSALGGLPSEGVVGVFTGAGDHLDPERFRPNRAFIDFMHAVVGRAGPRDASLRAAAAAQGDGWVYVIDLRTPEGPQGRVPPEDIVGAFEVAGGRVVEGSYRPNENHRVFTRHGMVRLPLSLQLALVAELEQRAGAQGGARPARERAAPGSD